MKNYFYYNTQIGRMCIVDNGNSITNISVHDDIDTKYMNCCETKLIKKAYDEICEYLDGKRKSFDIPLEPNGTEFQRKVWNELRNIPYGQTSSYKQVAKSIGNPKACRAVGMANNKNPILIVIPCHRVIGANGSLVGYAAGLDIKKKLLELEKDNR